MGNQKHVSELIKSLSGQANIIAIPRIYIDLLDGDINAAMLLSQIVYWSDKSKRKDGWFYKSFSEWNQEIGLSQYKVKRATQMLQEKKLIQVALHRANGAPTLHYKLDFPLLTNSIMKFLDNRETLQSDYEVSLQSDYEETEQSLTEITTEINSKNTLVVSEETEQQRPNIYSIYEQEIGVLGPMIAQELDMIEKEYPDGWFEKAVREAKLSSTRVSLKYILAILDRWKTDGINPLEDDKPKKDPEIEWITDENGNQKAVIKQ